jgi:hypothetical protein
MKLINLIDYLFSFTCRINDPLDNVLVERQFILDILRK